MKNVLTEEKVNIAKMLYESGVKIGVIEKAAGMSGASIHRLMASGWDLTKARERAAAEFQKTREVEKDTPAKEVSTNDITSLLGQLATLVNSLNRQSKLMAEILTLLADNKKEAEIVRQLKMDEANESIDELKDSEYD